MGDSESGGVTVSPHHLCLPRFLVSHTQQPPTRARNSSDNLDNPNSAPNNSRSLGTRTRTKRSESLSFPELPTRIPMSEQHFLGKQWTFTTLFEVQRGWKDRATSRVTKFYFNFFFFFKAFSSFLLLKECQSWLHVHREDVQKYLQTELSQVSNTPAVRWSLPVSEPIINIQILTARVIF